MPAAGVRRRQRDDPDRARPTLRALASLTSDRLQARLRALRLGEIREVRGCGAMVAVETSLNAADAAAPSRARE